jgi:hypothetical protein
MRQPFIALADMAQRIGRRNGAEPADSLHVARRDARDVE